MHLYLKEADGTPRLAATSLRGAGFGSEYRLEPGTGIDGEALQTLQPAILRRANGKIGYAALPLIAGSHLVGLLSIQAGDATDTSRGTLENWKEVAAAAAENDRTHGA